MRPNEVVANRVVGEVEGRVCILVDDMIDTGGTIVKAAETLFEAGAADVIVTATHGVLSGPAVDRLKNSQVSEVIVTNTLPIEPERHFDKLTVLSIAPLLARAIKEVFEDGSVTSLFDGARAGVLRTPPRPRAVPCAGPLAWEPPAAVAAARRHSGPASAPALRVGRTSAIAALPGEGAVRCSVIDVRLPSGVCRARAPARRPDPPLEEHITVADFRLEAETRTEFGKGSARRTRRAGRVPAVLYGHGQDVVHLSLPAREFAAALRNGGANALLTIVLDGKEQLALTKAVQRDPLTRMHEHVDLLLVRRGEKTTVDVPIVIVGETGARHDPEPPAQHRLDRGRRHEAAREHRGRHHRPRRRAGHHRRRPACCRSGATLITDPEALVIGFLGAPTAEALEAELEEAEAEAGIEREESDGRRGPQGDVVAEPQDQGSGESMDSAENEPEASADRQHDPRGRRHCRRPRLGVPAAAPRGPFLVVGLGNPGPGLRRQPAQRRRDGARRARRPRRHPALAGQGRPRARARRRGPAGRPPGGARPAR